jgi:hypothetical protein
MILFNSVIGWLQFTGQLSPSLRAKRGNPEANHYYVEVDCFASLAMTARV